MLNRFVGRENYGRFMGWVFAKAGTTWRLAPIAANGQPGIAAYRLGGSGVFELHTLQVFTVTASGISRNTVFQGAEVFEAFGLPTSPDRSLPGPPSSAGGVLCPWGAAESGARCTGVAANAAGRLAPQAFAAAGSGPDQVTGRTGGRPCALRARRSRSSA